MFLHIFNGVAHPVNIISGSVYDPEIRKYVGGEVVMTVPTNSLLNTYMIEEAFGEVEGIPLFSTYVDDCDELPLTEEETMYDMYIVSPMFASAYCASHVGSEACNRLYVVHTPVMSDDGRTFRGCRGLKKWL